MILTPYDHAFEQQANEDAHASLLEYPTVLKIPLPSDSLFAFGLGLNRHMTHSIKRDKRPDFEKDQEELGARISITFRKIATFQQVTDPPQRQPLGQLRPAQAQFKSPNVMLDHMLLGWRTPAKRLWRQELGRGAAPPPRPGAQLHVI